MITADIKKSLEDSVLCWLASVSKDGVPNVTPKETFTSYDDKMVLIANIASPGSVRNIKANPDVCLSFIDVFDQRGFKLVGKAEIIGRSNPEFEALYQPLYALAGDDYPVISIIKIEITETETIQAPSYKLFPDRAYGERLQDTYETYGVKPV